MTLRDVLVGHPVKDGATGLYYVVVSHNGSTHVAELRRISRSEAYALMSQLNHTIERSTSSQKH